MMKKKRRGRVLLAAVILMLLASCRITDVSEDDLYILRGYGKQKSGGFSIQIEEVSKSENAVFVRTKLVGPAAKEEQKGAASCPYVVLKTKAAAGISVVFED